MTDHDPLLSREPDDELGVQEIHKVETGHLADALRTSAYTGYCLVIAVVGLGYASIRIAGEKLDAARSQ